MKHKCSTCKKAKPLSSYYTSNKNKIGRSYSCKTCDKKRGIIGARKLKAKDPLGWYKKNRNLELIRTYGITLDEYEKMLIQQESSCYICKIKAPLHVCGYPVLAVDHDALTGKVRGLLCRPCNIAIGIFKHDVQILQRAIEYLAAGQLESQTRINPL